MWAGAANESESLQLQPQRSGGYFVPYFDGATNGGSWAGAANASESTLTLYRDERVDKHYDGLKDWAVSVEGASRYIGQGSAAIPSASFSLNTSPDSIMLQQEDMDLVSKDYGTFSGSVVEGGVGIVTANVTVEGALGRLTTEVNAIQQPVPYQRQGGLFISPIWNEWIFSDYSMTGFTVKFAEKLYDTVAVVGNWSDGSQSVVLFSDNGAKLHSFDYAAGHPEIVGVSHDSSNTMDVLWVEGGSWIIQGYLWIVRTDGIYPSGTGEFESLRITAPRGTALPFSGTNALGRPDTAGNNYKNYAIFGTTQGYVVRNVVTDGTGRNATGQIANATPVYTSWNPSAVFSGMLTQTNVNPVFTVIVAGGTDAAPNLRIVRNASVVRTVTAAEMNPLGLPIARVRSIKRSDRSSTNAFSVYWGEDSFAEMYYNTASTPDVTSLQSSVPGAAGAIGMLSSSYILKTDGIYRSNYAYYSAHDNIEFIASRIKPYTGAFVNAPYAGYNLYPVPGWVDAPWNKLNELAATLQIQITQGEGYLCAFQSTNWSDKTKIDNMQFRSVDLSADQAYRFVDIEYLDSQFVSQLPTPSTTTNIGSQYVMYDAFLEDQTFSVESGKEITEELRTTNYPLALLQPIRTSVIGQANWANRYYVIGSDDLPVVANQWEDYGGRVRVEIDRDEPGQINLIITGPQGDIPGVPGPYTIGISNGKVTRGAISIAGAGIKTSPKTLQLSTGADWSKVTEESSGSALQNLYVRTLDQAYEHGARAAYNSRGTGVGLTISIPYSDAAGFALTIGSEHLWRDARWRVVNCEFTRAEVVLTLRQVTTVAEFNKAWRDTATLNSVSRFNALWRQYKAKDFALAPLRVPRP